MLSAALAQDGELLSDEPYAEWADRARERLDALRQEARLVLARDRAKGAGRGAPDDVTAAWLAVLDHDPACEEAAAALIRGYLGAGRPEQAARVFERSRAALEELGLRISPSLERVYAAADARRLPSPVPPEPSAEPAPPASPAAAHAAHTARPSAPAASRAHAAHQSGPFGPGPVPEPRGSATNGPAATNGHPPRHEPPRVPREERRLVTMLFAEVAAPAGLAARLGLEALRDHVGASLAAVIAEVEALGGTVSSVSGRGLQAMFGAPQTHEDDPERAVRAAYRALSATAASVPALALPRRAAAGRRRLLAGLRRGDGTDAADRRRVGSRPRRTDRRRREGGICRARRRRQRGGGASIRGTPRRGARRPGDQGGDRAPVQLG